MVNWSDQAGGQREPMTARKIALLIGNDSYRDPRLMPLVVPGEDVRGLEAVLADPAIGAFDEVRPLLNADRTGVAEEIERLFAQAQRDDLVLLYFSGHGLLDRLGRLYLALAETKTDRLVTSALRSDDLRDLMEEGRCQRQVLILDCCYSGAFARPAKDAGDAPAVTPATFASQGEGRVALLSSTATQRSLEGHQVQGEIERSLFTHFLVEGLKTGESAAGAELITEEALFQYAYDRVRAAGAGMTPQRWVGRQHGRLVIARNPVWRPDPRSLLPGRLLAALDDPEPFVREGAVRELGRRLAEPAQREAVRAVLEARLQVERDRIVYAEIRDALARVSGADPTAPGKASGGGRAGGAAAPGGRGSAVPVSPVAAPAKAGPEPLSAFRDRLKDGGEGPELVWLPPDTFLMGSPDGDDLAFPEEKPQHEVRIARPFAIGRFPVTFADYDRFCAAAGREQPADEGWGRDRRPVIDVSWEDAVAYCLWLTGQTGRTYRLPSEAEWEYACRAGTRTRWSFGDDEQALGAHAWFEGNAGGKTHPVGEKEPNPWGLYDLHGNVREWVQDHWHGSYQGAPADANAWETTAGGWRVLRGGSWLGEAQDLRSAYRDRGGPGSRDLRRGFRLALGPEPGK